MHRGSDGNACVSVQIIGVYLCRYVDRYRYRFGTCMDVDMDSSLDMYRYVASAMRSKWCVSVQIYG